MLDGRLKTCAEFVSGKGIACDVGTDHAYLATYLIINEKCEKVIASDINEGPLGFAKTTVEKNGVADRVQLILTAGLENIPSYGVTDVVIAGMGAETIIKILDGVEWIKNEVNLILQPMSKDSLLREWLYKNGFEIVEEKAVNDDRFTYTVMKTVYSGHIFNISEFSKNVGRFNYSLEESRNYAEKRAEKFKRIALGLDEAGQYKAASVNYDLYNQIIPLSKGDVSVSVEQVFNVLNDFAPFGNQSKWDNSGLIVGDMNAKVHKILIALDITNRVVSEAVEIGADLIISHHPVIFDALKSINTNNPVYRLIQNNISAICIHTPYDISVGGINDIILNEISVKTGDKCYDIMPLERISEDGAGFGRVFNLSEEWSAYDLGVLLKDVFECDAVKYFDSGKDIRRVGICSGSGGSMLDVAILNNCDCYITGDIKHDVWIDAENKGLTLFDCGHFYTENIAMKNLVDVLKANLPFVEISVAQSSNTLVKYVK